MLQARNTRWVSTSRLTARAAWEAGPELPRCCELFDGGLWLALAAADSRAPRSGGVHSPDPACQPDVFVVCNRHWIHLHKHEAARVFHGEVLRAVRRRDRERGRECPSQLRHNAEDVSIRETGAVAAVGCVEGPEAQLR